MDSGCMDDTIRGRHRLTCLALQDRADHRGPGRTGAPDGSTRVRRIPGPDLYGCRFRGASEDRLTLRALAQTRVDATSPGWTGGICDRL